MDLLILILFSLFAVMDSLRWTIKTPSDVLKDSPVTLEWTASLTTDEKLRANRFSLILLEREMFLYSNRWQVMVVKAFLGGMHKEIGNHSSFDVIPGNDMSVRLKKVTDTDLTRFRCTFVSSFAAPKSIIRVEIKDLPIKVRLVGGATPYKGRVEVYRNGYWGTVCSDGWDVLDASVVCRMMGYIGAWTANCCSEYQGGRGPVWLSDLSCTGRETSLSECGHSGWGMNNCDHRKDAEVICHNSPVKTVPHSIAVTTPQVLHSRTSTFSSIRVSSFVSLSSTFHSMQTHFLSPTLATTAISPKAASKFSSRMTIVPSEISPTPSEAVSRSAILTSPPAVYVQILDDLYGFPNQGRVSLYYNGQWGTVCDDSWNIDDAQVVCHMLGYPRAIGFTTRSHFGGAKGGPIWMDEVKCKGTENTLAACPHGGWGISDCNHSKDAGVICDFNYTVNAKDASCNFDTWYCGWDNGPGNPVAFKWTRQFGRTSSYNTGPSWDHTTGSGYYFFIEASWRSGGDVARLETPKIQSNGNATCMVFYYHLYGQSIGTLRVKVGDQVLWELSGNQGDSWYKATVPLNFNGIYKVTFEGVVGNTAFSDIAIDDVEFQENTVCEKTAETLVFPKIQWISPNGEAEPGDNVTLNCTATGLPTPRVLWRKDGRILREREATANITIFNISEADGGSYECLAINIVGNDTKTATINVRGGPKETIMTTDAPYNVPARGESVAIRCSSKGFPVPVCRLYREGNFIRDVNSRDFFVQNFTSADQGEYTCNCSNVAGVDVAKLKLSLYESPSIDTILPLHQLRNETDTFKLFCNATGYPPPTVMWSKDAKPSKVFPTGMTLRIENAHKSDFGHYKCTALSVRGENVTVVASVELDYYSPVIDVVPGNITVLENERRSVKFFCNATGRPPAQISWVKEGIEVGYGNTLLITSADRSNRGEYRCVARNGVGNSASISVYLDVQYNPSFTRLGTDKINSFVRGNGRIEFTCVTDANPPASQYRFYHDDVYLIASLTGKYVIQKARQFDVGTYTCVPFNSLGTGTNSSVNISVYGAFSIIYSPQNITVNESESASFFCNATSYPPHQTLATHVTWSKLGDSSKVFPPGQELILSNVDRRDAGTYICKAENGLGFPDTAAAVLSVLHKPYDTRLEASVPDNIGVLNSSVTLRCSADANPPVTEYKIYHNGILVSNSDSGIFNITRARVEDNGSYVCIPFNDFGPGERASVNVSFVDPCGVKRVYASWSPQIVGGVAAKAGEWPWQVQLGYFDDSESSPHICGGSILDHYWVATAAHCIKSRFKLRIATNLNVTVGELRRGVPEGSEQNIPAEKIILHKEFNVINLQNDIALIKLKQPILFNAHVSPICLPDVDFAVGTTCYVTGWGRLGPIGSVSHVLQETAIPLFDHWLCKQYYKQNNVNEVTSDMRCAGTLGQSQGTCKADSGGPLACEKHGRWYLLGITSWSNGGCMDQGDPGVFSDTFFFRKWIKDVIANNTRTSL